MNDQAIQLKKLTLTALFISWRPLGTVRFLSVRRRPRLSLAALDQRAPGCALGLALFDGRRLLYFVYPYSHGRRYDPGLSGQHDRCLPFGDPL